MTFITYRWLGWFAALILLRKPRFESIWSPALYGVHFLVQLLSLLCNFWFYILHTESLPSLLFIFSWYCDCISSTSLTLHVSNMSIPRTPCPMRSNKVLVINIILQLHDTLLFKIIISNALFFFRNVMGLLPKVIEAISWKFLVLITILYHSFSFSLNLH